ncbi:MAG: hypothetical protein ACFB0E_21220 [Leptolyngbyaceae cyanobacterium]
MAYSVTPRKLKQVIVIRIILGCLCLVLTCSIGAISVFYVGIVVYYEALYKAIAAEQLLGGNPLAGSENYVDAIMLMINAAIFLSAGLLVGLLTTVQIAHVTRLWSSRNWWLTGSLMLITELATCLGVGMLLGLLIGSNVYARDPNAPPPDYRLWQFLLTHLGIGLIGTNFWLPRLIRMLSSSR